MKIQPCYIIPFLFFILRFAGFTQEHNEELNFYRPPVFRHYDRNDGLSSNVANSIIQDSLGFIWIGTEDGLNRYDGIDFKIYEVGREGASFISTPTVNVVLEGRGGLIWIGTEGGGLNCYDPLTERIWFFFHDPHDTNSLANNKISALCEDTHGNLWVGTANGLDLIKISYKKTLSTLEKPIYCTFTHFNKIPSAHGSLGDNRILSLFIDHHNNLWVGTAASGVNKLDISGPEIDSFGEGLNLLSNQKRHKDNSVFKHFVKSDGLAGLFVLGIFFPRTSAKGALWSFILGTFTLLLIRFCTGISFLLYGFICIISVIIFGTIVSFIFPDKSKNLKGLTYKYLDK